ncbi:MAG: UbiA family prenyltransferase [Dehalococcoidia bacterium]|nr:MAG: UbiA family prenyltransferase [Dehalococcoidia bacterium]
MKTAIFDFLLNWGLPHSESTIKNRILGFISEQRPLVAAMLFPAVLACATLALTRFPDLGDVAVILIVVYLAVACMHVLNDLIDADRDRMKWPLRPLPTGLVSRGEAAIYALAMGITSLILAFYCFNWQLPLVIFLTLVLGSIYTAYTRDKVGYLTLIFIPALAPIGVWVAFSAQTVFSWTPWLLFLFVALHQIGHIVATEIHLSEARPLLIKPKWESMLYGFSVIAMFIVGIFLYFVAHLHWIYLAILAACTAMALIAFIPFAKDPKSINNVKNAQIVMVTGSIFVSVGLLLGAL